MDTHRIAALTSPLTRVPSRRDVLRGLAGATFGLGIARLPDEAEAKKRKKKRKKSKKPNAPQPNEYGCLDVGAMCSDAGQCCSGVCEGKTCRAHHAGICQVDSDLCTTGAAHICGLALEVGTACVCALTTGGAPFCGDFADGPPCRDCDRDTDCEEEFGPGAACVVQKGVCEGACTDTGDTACVGPCPKPAK